MSQELRSDRGMSYSTYRVATCRVAAECVLGSPVTITSVDDYDAWESLFRKGLDYVTDHYPKLLHYKHAAIGGAAVFAYPTNPAAVEGFTDRLLSKVPRDAHDPTLLLNNWLEGMRSGKLKSTVKVSAVTTQSVKVYSGRVLRGIQADIDGEKIRKLYSVDYAFERFRPYYQSPDVLAQLARLTQFCQTLSLS